MLTTYKVMTGHAQNCGGYSRKCAIKISDECVKFRSQQVRRAATTGVQYRLPSNLSLSNVQIPMILWDHMTTRCRIHSIINNRTTQRPKNSGVSQPPIVLDPLSWRISKSCVDTSHTEPDTLILVANANSRHFRSVKNVRKISPCNWKVYVVQKSGRRVLVFRAQGTSKQSKVSVPSIFEGAEFEFLGCFLWFLCNVYVYGLYECIITWPFSTCALNVQETTFGIYICPKGMYRLCLHTY